MYCVFCGAVFFAMYSFLSSHVQTNILHLPLSASYTHSRLYIFCTISMKYALCDKYLKNQNTAKDTIHKISAIDCFQITRTASVLRWSHSGLWSCPRSSPQHSWRRFEASAIRQTFCRFLQWPAR